jgi:hypothetical protein
MRLLKTLVIALGVILVVAFGALVVIVMNRMNARPPTPPTAVVAPPVPAPAIEPPPVLPSLPTGQPLPQHFTPNFGEQALVLPPGARISDFSTGGNRLVLRVIMADQTQQLVVVDLNTGALIGTLNVQNSGEPAPTSMMPAVPNVNVPPRNAQEGKK